MRTLILYLEEGQKINAAKLTKDLESIEGTFDINSKDFASATVACEFKYGEDRATLRMVGEPTALAIEGISPAGLKLAWEVQKRNSRPFRVTEGGYSFDFSMSEISSLKELEKRINEQYFDKVAEARIRVAETEMQVEEIQAA